MLESFVGGDDQLVHVAILASPGMGHLIPSLQLSNRLVSLYKNIQVSFFIATAVDASSAAQTKLLKSLDPPPSQQQQQQRLHFIHLPPVDLTNMDPNDSTEPLNQISFVIRESLPAFRSYIDDTAQSSKPKVLIVDMFGTDAFEMAESLNMSNYLFVTTNATAFAYMAHVPKLAQEIEGEFCELAEPLRIPGCEPIPIEFLGKVFMDRKSKTHQCFLHLARKIVKASGVLINTFEDLEPQTIRSLNSGLIEVPRVYPVGPLVTVMSFDRIETIDCLMWLDAQPLDSVLFISFGSGGTLSAEQITELAWGLEQSGQRFIWVVRSPHDSIASAAYFGELNDLSGFLPDGFLTRTKDVGFVAPNWAPQVEILSHDSVSAFLSHCGWNSTLESIVHGVPLIAYPLFAEQGLNAWILAEDLKVAVRSSSKGVIRRDEIERMIRTVMEEDQGKDIRKRAKELQETADLSLEKGGSSNSSLSQIVKEWVKESLTL